MLLVTTYHYIDEEDKYKNGIYPVSPKRLSKQLDFLSKNFEFISQIDLLEAVEGRKKIPEMSCLITFDDGLKNQYEKALPILQEKNIPAIFFLCSLPYVKKRACLVHKIHWLRSIFSSEDFLMLIKNKIEEIFNRNISYYLTEENSKKASLKYRYDSPEDASIKFLLNSVLANNEKEKIIGNIFSCVVKNEEEFVDKFYLSEDEAKKLHDLGFLGLHSYDHTPLSSLEGEKLKSNLRENKKHIENLVGGEVFSISYPYGSKFDVSEETIRVCDDLGIKLGFTTERSFNNSVKNSLLFARADANDIPGGKKPVFEFNVGGIKMCGNFQSKRGIFIND